MKVLKVYKLSIHHLLKLKCAYGAFHLQMYTLRHLFISEG